MFSRENSDVASLSFDYFGPGQMLTDGSCRKIGTAQNDYFDFCQTAKKEWLLLSCTEEWVDDVDDQ